MTCAPLLPPLMATGTPLFPPLHSGGLGLGSVAAITMAGAANAKATADRRKENALRRETISDSIFSLISSPPLARGQQARISYHRHRLVSPEIFLRVSRLAVPKFVVTDGLWQLT